MIPGLVIRSRFMVNQPQLSWGCEMHFPVCFVGLQADVNAAVLASCACSTLLPCPMLLLDGCLQVHPLGGRCHADSLVQDLCGPGRLHPAGGHRGLRPSGSGCDLDTQRLRMLCRQCWFTGSHDELSAYDCFQASVAGHHSSIRSVDLLKSCLQWPHMAALSTEETGQCFVPGRCLAHCSLVLMAPSAPSHVCSQAVSHVSHCRL